MKDKILIFIIGLLVGAIISTGAFYIYSKSNACDCSNTNTQMNGGTPPEMPSGQNNGQPPEKPDGNGGMPWGMWNQSNSVTYSWANVISSTTTASNKTYSSTTSSQNALLVEGWSSTLTNITVNKSWDSDRKSTRLNSSH